MANLFDIGAGGSRIRYFVCNSNEEFILNTLELVSVDEYLYRVLINEGYERIVFLDEDVSAFAYDKFSKISFEKVAEVEQEGDRLTTEKKEKLISEMERTSINNTNVLSTLKMNGLKKVTPVHQTTVVEDSKYGRRKVIWTETQWNSHVRRCLESNCVNTAFVIPISRFSKGGDKRKRADMIRDTLNRAVHTRNIVIFKLDNEEQFVTNWANDEDVRTMDPDMSVVFKNHTEGRTGENPQSVLKNRLVKVTGLNCNDIANCILRLKYVETSGENRYYSSFNVTEIYLLGRAILERIKNNKCVVTGNDNTLINGNAGITTLYDIVKNHAKAIEKEYKKKIDDEKWNYVSQVNVSSYGIERVTSRYTIENIKQTEMSVNDILKEFSDFVGNGMESIKKQIVDTIRFFKAEKENYQINKEKGINVTIDDLPYYTMKFVGPPGTGKTATADIVAKLMHTYGILPTSKVIKMDATNLVKGHLGETADEIRKEAAKALGGVLFIDEFYALNKAYNGGNIASDAVEAIMGILNEDRENICIILCGYEEQVNEVLNFNPGAESRFTNRIKFENYSTEDLMEILDDALKKKNRTITEAARGAVKRIMESDKALMKERFGNARYIKKDLIDRIEKIYLASRAEDRVYTLENVLEAYPEQRQNIEQTDLTEEDILKEFSNFVGDGMDSIKIQILNTIRFFKSKREKYERKSMEGKVVSEDDLPYYTMKFVGPPGTGKTATAGIVAKLMHAYGILPTSKVVKIDATNLVKGHLGETADEIRMEAAKALGGVLVIDEFYALNKAYNGGNIASDAVEAIMGILNEDKKNICIIICGYENQVNEVLKFNPGARRRFTRNIEFKNYSTEDLMAIMDLLLEKDERTMTESARNVVKGIIETNRTVLGEEFGNAGYIKETLIADIEMQYLASEAEDGVYTLEHVLSAYPDYE